MEVEEGKSESGTFLPDSNIKLIKSDIYTHVVKLKAMPYLLLSSYNECFR